VVEDVKKEAFLNKELFAKSEQIRGQLQDHIKETSIKLDKDTSEHAAF
jgi:hypothetical protein